MEHNVMANNSSIEWTGSTWNPVTGCSKISPGCKNCYAERMTRRLRAMKQPNYTNGFKLTVHHDLLERPLRWKKPQTIFVNSMSDLFHKDVPTEFIKDTFNVMNKAYWHRFQILTKRSGRLLKLSHQLNWGSNIWMGVSVETENYKHRIENLRLTAATIKFLSIEPFLGPINNLILDNIDWVIVGGESGPRARPMNKSWVTDIRDQCLKKDVPFFFKQWGGFNKKKTGRILDGKIWDEMPAIAV